MYDILYLVITLTYERNIYMNNCPFCKLDTVSIANTIIEETENFYITPSLGSLVEGYLLIINKSHINSMAELNEIQKKEYSDILEKYRDIFFNIYGRYPIIFEHGTSPLSPTNSSSSVIHAHTHIVNHNYKDEKSILELLNFQKFNSLDFQLNKNYIFYINPKGYSYISYEFQPTSQIMRLFIAKDLDIENKYNWKEHQFTENIIKTLKRLQN